MMCFRLVGCQTKHRYNMVAICRIFAFLPGRVKDKNMKHQGATWQIFDKDTTHFTRLVFSCYFFMSLCVCLADWKIENTTEVDFCLYSYVWPFVLSPCHMKNWTFLSSWGWVKLWKDKKKKHTKVNLCQRKKTCKFKIFHLSKVKMLKHENTTKYFFRRKQRNYK